MKCSFAKATAFCAEHGMCLDEIPTTRSKGFPSEAFIVENNKVPGNPLKICDFVSGSGS